MSTVGRSEQFAAHLGVVRRHQPCQVTLLLLGGQVRRPQLVDLKEAVLALGKTRRV